MFIVTFSFVESESYHRNNHNSGTTSDPGIAFPPRASRGGGGGGAGVSTHASSWIGASDYGATAAVSGDVSHGDAEFDAAATHDETTGATAARIAAVAGNPVLLRFALSLVNRIDDPLIRELTLGILRVCPDSVAA